MVIFKDKENRKYKRVSRWIQIRYNSVTERHSLYDFANHDSGESMLTYFFRKRKQYALGQFMRFDKPIRISNGKEEVVLCGYDALNYWNGYMIEISDCGDAIRLYTEVRTEE